MIAQANAEFDPKTEQTERPAGPGPRRRAGVRDRRAQGSRPDGRLADPDLVGGDRADPVPRARRRQPGADGLQHAAPGGAAAEARPAADRHRHGAPRRGRHRRRRPRRERRRSHPRRRRADRRQPRLEERRVPAAQVHALEPGHDHPPAADRQHRPEGEGGRRARRRLLDRRRRDRPRQELPGRLHVLGGLQLRGRDHPLRAPGQGRRTHLDPHRGVRDRRPHDQARRRGDHPRHPEPLRGEPAQPRRARHRPRRRRGRLRRPAGRQGDAEGRDRADRRGEADPRDLQGEGARGPRHLAQGPPRRGRRRHRRPHLQPRRRRRPAARRQRPGPRLRRDQAQDRRGRQARRPPREQGCDLEDRARGGHAPPRRRHPGRRHPQPARRAEPDEHRPDPRDPPRVGRGQRLVRRRLRGLQAGALRRGRRPRLRGDAGLRRGDRRGRRRGAGQLAGGERRARHRPRHRQERPSGRPLRRHGAALQRPHRRALRGQGHGRLHVHPQAAAPGRRQDPRPLDRPLLAGHPAAAGRQGAVRRPALRRDGGLGAGGLRRRLHAAGDAHGQVRRHGRPGQGLRGDRQGGEHPRALDPGVLQSPAEGDPEPLARRQRGLRGRRRRDLRRGRRPAESGRGAGHGPDRGSRRRPRQRRRRRAGGAGGRRGRGRHRGDGAGKAEEAEEAKVED